MDACLHDPEDGYYATRPGLGAAGDFITAPHVSQIFGELLGAWAAEILRQMGAPARVRLVELGPGDGTMMGDVLRAARAAPGFSEAIELVLMETSAPLRARQAERLTARWIASLDEIGDDAPVIVLANEFLDCLPIRQAVKCADGWRERRVGLDTHGALAFVAAEARDEIARDAPEGSIFEWSPALRAFGAEIGSLIGRTGGAALFIDYASEGFGDSLQALGRHEKEHPLRNPGLADLTAHVDFGALLAAAASVERHGPIGQGAFLKALGIEARAAALARANPSEAAKIGRQVARLTAPDQMGELFKVACIASPELTPPGFA
jgi:SAM-dependent MidA family methyltransferase